MNGRSEQLDFDVLIVGAGLSGIGAARHLQVHLPEKRFAILEGRERLGGTWDLFRYPGIRSDSDMHTMGYSFRPWIGDKAIADGASILEYLQETAREYGIERHIRYGQRVVGADWSSADACWTVEMESGAERKRAQLTCRFLFLCSGYYDYDAGYAPAFAGVECFKGRVVHPQHWPADLDYAGKRVVVIGSGATAVTLVPAMAKTAAHVTMLQRSPSYVASRPGADRIANWLRRVLPAKAAYWLARWKNILLAIFFYQLARRQPQKFSAMVIGGARAQLGDGYDVATHFTPRYKPWDQRLCLVPDGDLFKAIRKGAASVVTDEITGFTENGIQLVSGGELPADIVVTATGLKLQLASGRGYSVDGVPVNLAKSLNYKGVMFSEMPNFALTVGYTNASWTLKAELTSLYVCRLLKYMDRKGWRSCVPRVKDSTIEERPIIDFSSGYIQRALEHLPKQGSKRPWRLRQNYPLDLMTLRYGKLNDGNLEFSR
jgi:cation diffusion facilitator CzcD-associated flavoprotein CzcO